MRSAIFGLAGGEIANRLRQGERVSGAFRPSLILVLGDQVAMRLKSLQAFFEQIQKSFGGRGVLAARSEALNQFVLPKDQALRVADMAVGALKIGFLRHVAKAA